MAVPDATIAEIAKQHFGILAEQVLSSFDFGVYRLDVAIHEAAGLDWPPPGDIIPIIKHWDKVMFVTEWRDLMKKKPEDHPDWSPYAGIVPLRYRIMQPWDWQTAHRGWMRRAYDLLPALKGRRPA